jgi:hypothetical protein
VFVLEAEHLAKMQPSASQMAVRLDSDCPSSVDGDALATAVQSRRWPGHLTGPGTVAVMTGSSMAERLVVEAAADGMQQHRRLPGRGQATGPPAFCS